MIDYVENIEKLESLKSEWYRLEKDFNSPVLSYSWLRAGVEAFCPPYQIRIAVKMFGGRLSGVAPLGILKRTSKNLEVLGTTILTEEGGFLYDDTSVLAELADTVIQLKIPIFLRRIRFFSEEAKVWEREIKSRGLISLVREERLPWVSIRDGWDDFEKQISPTRRSSFRRLHRLLESKGNVRFEVIIPTPESFEKNLKEVFEVEAESWKARRGTAMKYNAKLGIFFKEYARQAMEVGELHLFFLRVGEKAVAVELTSVRAKRLWILKIGHDEAWSSYSPGILLMHQVIKYCFDNGLEACEFGGTDEPWLHIWANEFHSVWSYRIYPRSLIGLVQLTIGFIQIAVNKALTTLLVRRARKGDHVKEGRTERSH